MVYPLAPKEVEVLRSHGSEFILGIRPEYIRIVSEKGLVKARCVVREDLGTAVLLHLETRGGITLKAKLSPETSIKEGDEVYVKFPREKVRIFKKAGELVL